MIKVTIGNNIGRKSVILDENTTLRQALEQQSVDYTSGMTSIDGCTLLPGDLDKTFAEHGITEKCYLMTVVKADNAAVIKIAGGACVVESSATLEDLKILEKYRPEALELIKDEETDFLVGITGGNGAVTRYGVSFGQTTSDGKAVVTMMMPAGVENPAEWAAEHIGIAIIKLNRVEAQFEDALLDVAREMATVRENITVV